VRLPRWASTAVYVVLAVIMVALAAAIVIIWTAWRNGTLQPQDSTVASLLVAIVSVIVTIGIVILNRIQNRPELILRDKAASLVDALGYEIMSQWRVEARRRGLYEGHWIDLRWEVAAGSDLRSGLATTLPEGGTLNRLTTAFGQHVRGKGLTRLVVTGEVGGGKTALCALLTLELDDQSPVVPVLFQLASWDLRKSLHDWMLDELLDSYPFLTEHGKKVADHIVNHNILPILDGLDEVKDSATALRRIDADLEGRSFVLSCRTTNFAEANVDHVLHQALITELQPLRTEEVVNYLINCEPGGGRLASIITRLEDCPEGPLAEALRTPFMLSLVVAAGEPAEPIPAELLAAASADAADRIKRHLLGTFIDRAYSRTLLAEKEPVPPAKARRYLQFLARNVEPQTGRLAWWQLHHAVPRTVFLVVAIIIAGLGCSTLAAGFFALFERPWQGFWVGLVIGVTGALIVQAVPQEPPRARPTLRLIRSPSQYALLRTIGFGLTGGLACAVIVRILYESAYYVSVGGILSGLTFAAARYVSTPGDPLKAVTPDSLLRNDKMTALYAWLAGGFPGALTGAYLGWSFREGHRIPEFDNLELLSRSPAELALLGGLGGCLLSAAGLGLMRHGSSSWGRFNTTRSWLAARGRTPLRLMSFLRGAREREVLRQVGGYYEFRHQLLQHHLTGTDSEPEPALSGRQVGGLATNTKTGPDSVQ
jgi:hypothetical protein